MSLEDAWDRRFESRRLPRADRGPVLAYLQRLTAEDAELTPTMKLKRSLIKRK